MLCTDGPALFVSAGAGQLDGVVTGARVNGHIAQEHETLGGFSVLRGTGGLPTSPEIALIWIIE